MKAYGRKLGQWKEPGDPKSYIKSKKRERQEFVRVPILPVDNIMDEIINEYYSDRATKTTKLLINPYKKL